MKKILLIIPSLILILNVQSFAQGEFFSASWNIGFPNGDLKDFLNNEGISLGGAGLEYRHFIKENLSVGGYFAWDFFNGSDHELTSIDNIDVSGLKLFYVNYLPIMVNGHYYLGGSDGVKAYLGGGLGAVRTLRRTSIGSVDVENNNWHFGVYPEIGILIPAFDYSGISFGVKYHAAFETDNIRYSYLSVNLGFYFGTID